MAKKKNRKKAMKRQQKISIKVDPSGLFGDDGPRPIFVERCDPLNWTNRIWLFDNSMHNILSRN